MERVSTAEMAVRFYVILHENSLLKYEAVGNEVFTARISFRNGNKYRVFHWIDERIRVSIQGVDKSPLMKSFSVGNEIAELMK